MGTVSLNLSRKWRSQNFDQLVDQDLSVRILKNSLYLGHFFPVYLFVGQRGCGKTSTARIFAAALNCEQLSLFQQDPKSSSIPCLTCASCTAMQTGNHPDFIEIDAASHTGVDNMRNIIESSSLLPVMGSKRVYLIDEAHMLSKAAFNAALKILEEPPATAVFILATTNPHKIIDTVRSRCFQLFFTPLGYGPLKKHLEMICKAEKIIYDDQALDIIVRQTEGSARDALNMLEQVRFSSSAINKKAVLKLLGHISDQQVVDIIVITLGGSAEKLLEQLRLFSVEHYSAEFIWQRLMVLLRSLVWEKYGVSSDRLVSCSDIIQEVACHYSAAEFQGLIELLYSYEELFMKTSQQHILLEMILLSACQKDKKKTDDGSNSAPCLPPVSVTRLRNNDQMQTDESQSTKDHGTGSDENVLGNGHDQWRAVVERMVELNHPIVSSLFKQSRLLQYDHDKKEISLECPKELALFKDWIDQTRDVWQPVCKKIFSVDVRLEVHFTGMQKEVRSSQVHHAEKVSVRRAEEQPVSVQPHYKKKVVSSPQKNETHCDVSREGEWRVASMLLRHFPGVITEIRESL